MIIPTFVRVFFVLFAAWLFSPACAVADEFRCADLVATCFPPNQVSPVGAGAAEGHGDSLLSATQAGQWVEYRVNVPHAGTYAVRITASRSEVGGTYSLFVDGEAQGHPVDLYALLGTSTTQLVQSDLGNRTFLTPGRARFRFFVIGKNAHSQGYFLRFAAISLEPTQGFTLVAPNGSCWPGQLPLLTWNAVAGTAHYEILIDGVPAATVSGPVTWFQPKPLKAGRHVWSVLAVRADRQATRSNLLAFIVGPPPPYPFRECEDEFRSGQLTDYALSGFRLSPGADSAHNVLSCAGPADAVRRDVRLGMEEGEVSSTLVLRSPDAQAGVGFQADDGTRIYAVADAGRGQLRIERRVKGYSIFEVTAPRYRVAAWAERTEGESHVWEIASQTIGLSVGQPYRLRLAFSRRSQCVMATLSQGDGSDPVVLRDLVDSNAPDHPALVCVSGKAEFQNLRYHKLNKGVYKWDVETNRIVLRPGAPGEWDARGAFNPAVVVQGNLWQMVYRGNAVPAPPNSGPASQLGLATSRDGIHWTKSPANPIVKKLPGNDTVEDPDMLIPQGSNSIFLEANHHLILGESLLSGPDLLHLGEPWALPTRGLYSGKVCGIVDTHNPPAIPEIAYQGQHYRYVALIEEGAVILSNDLHQWVRIGSADLKGKPDWWCNDHECGGDLFVDHDGNFRVETQAGTNGRIVGNRKCSIMEDVLSGTDPTQVLVRSDLPYLPDWYGDAPTGDLNEVTFTNGSVFPGQTILKDGYLWHFYGGNNTYTGLIQCFYGPVFEYRNLMLSRSKQAAGQRFAVSVTVRNTGSLPGTESVPLTMDGKTRDGKEITLAPDTETTVSFDISLPPGHHQIAVHELTAALTL